VNPEDAARTIGQTLARLGVAETALEGVSHTVARPLKQVSAVTPLPTIAFDDASGATVDSGSDLVARGELGRGGMGVVHLVEQRSLSRDVAVKTTVGSDVLTAQALVREGRIMGSLEHPNLVPVHALGVGTAGAPVLVMKRIEGVSWRTLLSHPTHEGWRPLLAGHGDPLRANVDILSQVCRALAFAHERGVIHRDLKPENVMIGGYGEGYLVDWGLALRISERDSEPEAIVGTPGYLAPEMARGEPRLADQRTDVYLLGGALYEVLTGHMPHAAPTPLAALVLSLTGDVAPIPESAPSDLAHLARQAMALDPEDRVADAEAFREGLARFLASREVDRAVAEARTALAAARQEIEIGGAASLKAYRALIEARVTLVAARRARPADEEIRRDLDACVTHLVEREVALRSPAGARSMLMELTTPSPALEARLAALELELAAERAAAAALREDRRAADTSISLIASTRVLMVVAAAEVLLLAWLSWEIEFLGRALPLGAAIAGQTAVLLLALVGFFVGRRTILSTAASRRLTAFGIILSSAIVLNHAIFAALGRSSSDIVASSFGALAVLCALGAVALTPEFWLGSVVYLVGIVGVLAAPEWALAVSVPVTMAFVLAFGRAIQITAERTRTGTDPPT